MDEHGDNLTQAERAYAARDWATAATHFDAVAADRLTADDLAAYANAVWWLGRIEDNLRFERRGVRRLPGRLATGRGRRNRPGAWYLPCVAGRRAAGHGMDRTRRTPAGGSPGVSGARPPAAPDQGGTEPSGGAAGSGGGCSPPDPGARPPARTTRSGSAGSERRRPRSGQVRTRGRRAEAAGRGDGHGSGRPARPIRLGHPLLPHHRDFPRGR